MESRINNVKVGKRILVSILLVLLLVLPMITPAFAESVVLSANELKVENLTSRNLMQGQTNEVAFKIKNLSGKMLTYNEVEYVFDDKTSLKTSVNGTGTVSLAKDETAEISAEITVSQYAKTGERGFYFVLKNQNEPVYTSKYYYLTINKFTSTGQGENKVYIDGIRVICETMPQDGFYKNADNQITFVVYNSSNSILKNVSLKLTLPQGVGINNGSNTVDIGYLAVSEERTCSFNLLLDDDITTGNYVFTANVTGINQGDSSVSQERSFYVYVYGKDKKAEENSAEATPRLMVSNYSAGSGEILAGTSFPLNLDLENTSSRTLYNVKVSLSSDGTFVPENSSSSFYVDKIEPKSIYSKSMYLSSIPDAAQKTTPITVNMSYEDSDGNTYSADDTISIKVKQKTRLVVDEIVPPYEVYAGNQNSAEVEFYNMGRTTISNLRVTAEGDFDTYESNTEFFGNMSSGSDNSYSFGFVPRQAGPVEGMVVFTYDDVAGNTIVEEYPFTFEAMEMPVFEDPFGFDTPMEPEEKPIPWGAIIIAIVIVLSIVSLIVLKKIRKRLLNKKLELEDLAFERDNDALNTDTQAEDENEKTVK